MIGFLSFCLYYLIGILTSAAFNCYRGEKFDIDNNDHMALSVMIPVAWPIGWALVILYFVGRGIRVLTNYITDFCTSFKKEKEERK